MTNATKAAILITRAERINLRAEIARVNSMLDEILEQLMERAWGYDMARRHIVQNACTQGFNRNYRECARELRSVDAYNEFKSQALEILTALGY